MRRIVLWTLAGFNVACFWVLLAAAMGPGHNVGDWMIVSITLPASQLFRTVPVTYQEVIFLNTAIYGLIGLAIEPFWRMIASRHAASAPTLPDPRP